MKISKEEKNKRLVRKETLKKLDREHKEMFTDYIFENPEFANEMAEKYMSILENDVEDHLDEIIAGTYDINEIRTKLRNLFA